MQTANKANPDCRIQELIDLLVDTDQRLEQLLGAQADSVTDRQGRTMLLRRAQDELRQREAQTGRCERLLRKTLSSTTDCAYAFDRRGALLFANEPALKLWDLTLDDVVGRTVVDLGYPEALARRIEQQVEHVFATGQIVKDETPYVGPTGISGFFEYIFSPALAPDGSVDFAVGFSRDISERKRAEIDLRASVAEFFTLAAAMPQIVWTSSPLGEITYVNMQWVDQTGLGVAQAVGRTWAQVLGEHGDASGLPWAQVLAAAQPFASEVRLRGKDGQLRWWLMRAVPLLDDAGTLVKWLGTCTDVDQLKLAQTEASRANGELQRQRTELRVLFDLVPAMIWFKDTQNNFVRANERGARSVGRTVAQVEGRSAYEIYPEEADEFFAGDVAIMRSHTPIMGKVEMTRDVHGNERWISKDKVPYHDEAGNVIGVVVMSQDITERKRDQDALRELNDDLEARVRSRTAELALARDDAERANQAKSAFLATMSHEIRTPMSGMLGLLELLEVSQLDEEQLSTLDLARESGRALQRIIDGILDFSKIEADAMELDLAPASIREVVEGAGRLHGPVAASKGVALRTHVAAEISPLLLFDALRLGQIVNNFLGNAIKFTDDGQVAIEVALASSTLHTQQLRISVCDTGIGIAPEHLGRLFKPFAQADAQTNTRFGGTGLGLFIARRLAELMGGQVHLESRLGQGTTVTLCVELRVCAAGVHPQEQVGGSDPAALRSLLASRPAAPGAREAQLDGSLLLVVDDHPINRLVLLRQAAALGYAAEPAEDAARAVQAWASGRYAAILTDCNMPGMSGLEMTREIRAIEAAGGHARTPIIGCTANALPSAAAACLEAGMDDAVTKPADLNTISRTLDRWVPLGGARAGSAESANAGAASLFPANHGLLDVGTVNAISGGATAAALEVVGSLLGSSAADATAVRQALRTRDFDRVVHHAHRMRGACCMLGATRLAGACAALQTAASRDDADATARAMGPFEMELLRLTGYLDGILARAGQPVATRK